jgi:predicted transcriptional regulator
MGRVFKYRPNLINKKDGLTRDTKSLLNNQLYAPNISELNDPFECSIDFPSEKKHDWITYVKQKIHNVGIYSLAKQKEGESFPSNELLWAHYANSHKGFCIEYDMDTLTKNIKDFDIRNTINVNYENERPVLFEADDLLDQQSKIFGTKSNAWSYENEIRIIFETSGLKQYSNLSIKSIYFGLNMGYKERKDIIDGLKDKKITFYQMGRIKNLYKLTAIELDMNDFENYEIIGEKHNMNVNNYHILYKGENKDENSILTFVHEFRRYLTKPSNISIYDDICVKEFMYDYPITGNNELLLAKHWIAFSTFDAPDVVYMYPER